MPEMSSAKLNRVEARKLLANVINYPIFVPELGDGIKQALIAGDVAHFLSELSRLAALGSRPASTLLAYLHMKDVFQQATGLDRAQSLCIEAAHSGDAYSQYVMGWICRASGRDAEAMEWLRKAATKGLFEPAIVDIARFMAGGVGVAVPDLRAALATLWHGHQLGHRMALVYIAELSRRSGNLLRQVFGAILYPVALARATRYINRHPLSAHVFVTSLKTKHPLLKPSTARR